MSIKIIQHGRHSSTLVLMTSHANWTNTQHRPVWAVVNAQHVRSMCKLAVEISRNFNWYYYIENLFVGNTRYLNTRYSQHVCKWSTFSSTNWVCKLLAQWRPVNKTKHKAEWRNPTHFEQYFNMQLSNYILCLTLQFLKSHMAKAPLIQRPIIWKSW